MDIDIDALSECIELRRALKIACPDSTFRPRIGAIAALLATAGPEDDAALLRVAKNADEEAVRFIGALVKALRGRAEELKRAAGEGRQWRWLVREAAVSTAAPGNIRVELTIF